MESIIGNKTVAVNKNGEKYVDPVVAQQEPTKIILKKAEQKKESPKGYGGIPKGMTTGSGAPRRVESKPGVSVALGDKISYSDAKKKFKKEVLKKKK